jgi:hypothetical protein
MRASGVIASTQRIDFHAIAKIYFGLGRASRKRIAGNRG